MSAETLACRLDCSLSTIENYRRAKPLPQSVMIGNLVRWRWTCVEQHIASIGAEHEVDEYPGAIKRFHARDGQNEPNSRPD